MTRPREQPPPAIDAIAAVAAVAAILDDFHDAASRADGDRYFGHFAPDGVFLGTDPAERWTVTEFRKYAEPHFSSAGGGGGGHTYHSTTDAAYRYRRAGRLRGSTRGSGTTSTANVAAPAC